MATVHVMVGIPGSGKSTFSKEFSKANNIMIVSSDTVRNLHPDWEEKLIFPEVYRLVAEELKQNHDVILDATNVTKKVRVRIKEKLAPYEVEYDMEAYYFPIAYNVCYERVEKRNQDKNERYFPLDVLKSYYDTIEIPCFSEGFKEVHVMEQTKLEDMKDILTKGIIDNKEQGYAFFYSDKRGTVEDCNGIKGINQSDLIDFDTNFRLASVSKQFIAYGIYTLIKENKLSYDTKLNDIFYIGEYAKDITVKHMLNHNSGLLDYEDMDHTDKQIHDLDVLEFLKKQDHLFFEVGEKYQYSNTAYVILGLIIEKISKEKLGDYIYNNVFLKAGMTNSIVNYQGETEVSKRAYGHMLINDKIVLKDQYWCSATIGDGGLYSNLNDLKKWIKFLRKLYETDKEFFEANILPNGENSEYALGIRHIVRKGIDIIYHCGETIGFNTIVGFVPSENKEFILLTNLGDHSCSRLIDNLVEIL